MLDEELTKITTSMQEKLGKDNSAMIADDLGLLMTANGKAQEALSKAKAEIATLKADKEKLVLANGNLLKQIPMGNDISPTERKEKESFTSSFSFSDAFDERGNFR